MSGSHVHSALEVHGLGKSYGGAQALADLTFTVAQGEVHGLVGQNGCGKSTLVKSLTGVVTPDRGRVDLYGSPLSFPVTHPHRSGIAVVHQDLGLVESASVLDNLGVSARFGTGLLRPVPVRTERRVHQEIMDRLGVEVDLDALVGALSPAERSLVAVIRAVRLMNAHTQDQLFVLDEPTAALSRPEAAVVLDLMRRVADLGSAVLFISHRLTEVMAACDTVTVMRNGRAIATSPVQETNKADLVSLMLGRRMDDFYPAPPESAAANGSTRVEVRRMSGSRVREVSFVARAGEVLGVTGLAGMGQEEIPRLISGVDLPSAGGYQVDGVDRRFRSPFDAIAAGVALVPGDRLRDGLWLGGTVEENVTLPVVADLSSRGRLARRRLRALAEQLIRDFRVRPPRIDADTGSLSGGNQQKVVFAKWVQRRPGVLLLDEPVQGVDPGAARDLLDIALSLAASGSSVVVFSGDHELLAAICHRVIVISHGRVSGQFQAPAITEHALLEACQGQGDGVAA